MFFRSIAISLILSTVLVGVPIGTRTRADGPTIVINELLWMGSSASSADEWIELRNVSDQSIDLSNWQLTKKSSGAESLMLTIPAGKSIPANGYFLISNYAETNANSVLVVTPDLVDTSVALSNSALQIRLYDATHTLIDVADDGVGNPAAGKYISSQAVFSSMERNPMPGDGMQSSSWHTASRSVGYKAGSPERGTPGSENSNGVPTANAGPDQTVMVGQAVNFDGSDSTDPEQQPLTYAWDFGDSATDTTVTPQHTYAAAGVYTATLQVSDGTDAVSDTMHVTVTAAPAAAPSSTDTTDAPIVTNSSCRGLRLSEVYPNPPGVDADEFIELQNGADEDVVGQGCSVWTTATKKFVITSTDVTTKNGYLELPKSVTKLTLNNGGTTVRLVDVDGAELDRVTYGTAKEGTAYVMINGAWQWTGQPTPGKSNVLTSISTAKTTSSKTAAKKSSTKEPDPIQIVSIADVQHLDSGDRVQVTGIVTSPVGSLGSTLTTLQSADGGITLTVPNGTGPLDVGEQAKITGTVRLYQGRRRIAVDANGVQVLQKNVDLQPQMLATVDIGSDQADQLVHTTGIVALASGASIDIDDGSGDVVVYLKSSTGIVRPKVKMGDAVDVIGIVGVSTSGVRVLPRSQADLHVQQVLGASTSAPTATTTVPTHTTHQSAWYWLFVGLGGLAVAAKPLWNKWRKSQTT